MIFISYSHRDDKAAGKLNRELEAAYYSTFLAHDDVVPATDWHVEIWAALKGCHAFVGLLTENFNESAFCQQEVGAALALDKPHVLVVDGAKHRPPGFAARFQTVKRDELLETLNESPTFREARVDAWIEANKKADSYEEANLIHRRFWQEWEDMKTRERLHWLVAAASNSQVRDEGFTAGPFFKQALQQLKPRLTGDWLAENDPDEDVRGMLRQLDRE